MAAVRKSVFAEKDMRIRALLVLAGILAASTCLAEETATLVGFVEDVAADGGIALTIRDGTGAMKEMVGKKLTCYFAEGEKARPLKDDRLRASVQFVRAESGGRYVLSNVEMLPPGSPVAYRIIRDERTSAVGGEATLVLETTEQLGQLWDALYEHMQDKPKMPEIDFDTQVLLALFMGPQAGKDSHMTIIDITETRKSVNVYLRYTEKGEAGAPSTPFLLVTIDRRQLPIVFIDETPRPNSDYYVTAETLAEGDKSSWDKEETVVIDNKEQFAAAWDKLYEYRKVKPDLPAVDFDRETVVLAAWGVKRDAGYSVSAPAVFQRDNAVHVMALKHTPANSGGRGHFQPFIMVKFPKPQVPIVIEYEMEMVGDALEGAECKVDKMGVATVTTAEKAAELAKASGLDEAGATKLRVVNYDHNMAVVVFTGAISSSVKLSIDRVYRTEKEIVVEAAMERTKSMEDIPTMQATILITEKSDLPIVFQKSRLRKESYPFRPVP